MIKNSDVEPVGRLRTIDGLRGLAALSVVFYHLYGNLKTELGAILPEAVKLILSLGYLGVPVFFVISGLVISLSIGDKKINFLFASRFILRRSVRLDPTYWGAIAFALILLVIQNHIASPDPFPSVGNILAHMFYLQELLSVSPSISVVFWTLCLEVQFYLCYLFLTWVVQKIFSDVSWHLALMVVMISLGVYSLFLDRDLFQLPIPGLFVSNWHYFLLGVLLAGVYRRKNLAAPVFFCWVFFEVLANVYFGNKPYQAAGIGISVALYLFWRQGVMNELFTSRALQYFGRISYPLYLLHADIGWKTISLVRMVFKGQIPHDFALPAFFAAIFVSIAVANVFHVILERPSLAFAEKLKRSDQSRSS